MKKVFAIILIVFMLMMAVSCKKIQQNNATEDMSNQAGKISDISETSVIKTAIAPIAPQKIVEESGNEIEISSTVSFPPPPTNESAKFEQSAAVVRAVITNSKNIVYTDENGYSQVVTLYDFFIEEVFKGDIPLGETIQIVREGGHMPYERFFETHIIKKYPDAKMERNLVETEVWFGTTMGRQQYQKGEELILYLVETDEEYKNIMGKYTGCDNLKYGFSELWGMKQLVRLKDDSTKTYPRTAYGDNGVFIASETIDEAALDIIGEDGKPITLEQFREKAADLV